MIARFTGLVTRHQSSAW